MAGVLLACLLWLPVARGEEAGLRMDAPAPGAGLRLPADAAVDTLPLRTGPDGSEAPSYAIVPSPAAQRGADEDTLDGDETPLETGLASWYGQRFHRRRTASGELFDMNAMTAAHRTLAFGTRICVRSRETGKGVVVRVNDRGPHVANRIVDLSRGAAMALGVHGLGLKSVDVFPLDDDAVACPPASWDDLPQRFAPPVADESAAPKVSHRRAKPPPPRLRRSP